MRGASAGELPSSGRSGPTPQAGFPPLPKGEGERNPPCSRLRGPWRSRGREGGDARDPGVMRFVIQLDRAFDDDVPFEGVAA